MNLEPTSKTTQLWIWRHPRPRAVKGRCIGQTDVPVDPRKIRRLARKIDRHARSHGLARHVFTSRLQRSLQVGRHLRKLGWRHTVDMRLSELDFGLWDGQRWDHIGKAAMDRWCQDFDQHRPGGGESVAMLWQRCADFVQSLAPASTACVVGHAGWINLARLLAQGHKPPVLLEQWAQTLFYEEKVQLKLTCG
jgi:alpha-ribazole phosphatase